MKNYTIEVVFFEALKFTVEVSIAPAEPDVGMMNDAIEEWDIIRVDDCADKAVVKFFNDKIEVSKALLSDWVDALYDALWKEGL